MATNNIVEILSLQLKVAEMEASIAPLRAEHPDDPELRKFELDLAYNRGLLDAFLQVAEDMASRKLS